MELELTAGVEERPTRVEKDPTRYTFVEFLCWRWRVWRWQLAWYAVRFVPAILIAAGLGLFGWLAYRVMGGR